LLGNVTDYILLTVLFSAVYFDLTQKRIPNFLTLPAAGLGFIIFAVDGGLDGLVSGLAGFGVGIAVFFLPFALGGIGGGDVKLMGAIGALKGVGFILYAALFTALAGGLLALFYLLLSGQLLPMLRKVFFLGAGFFAKMLYFRLRSPYFNHLSLYCHAKLEERPLELKQAALPYGVAIALGTLVVLGNEIKAFLPPLLG